MELDPVDHEKEAREQALNDFFFDLYGIPRSWADQMVSVGGHVLSEIWKERIEFFEKHVKLPVEKGK